MWGREKKRVMDQSAPLPNPSSHYIPAVTVATPTGLGIKSFSGEDRMAASGAPMIEEAWPLLPTPNLYIARWMVVSGGSDAAVVQVPPRTLARKTDGVTPYSKQYTDPFLRKQSRHERITPLLGCLKPQSGKVGQDMES
ncbi:hypothetical protein F8388_003830 [Cannabis sativa]|uniref:Uncharacterized protein n=1 Tax=Cannabis sativa TaxID=3483 RepID=A0A7J6I0A3_CANSA|nr:hypothetical protein F8388_003830 [Cannabis sativa]KAF4400982.1 hypothetical protein G4B88_013823 [Cannabis sativa]